MNKPINRHERKWVFNNLDYNQICIYLYKSNFFFKEHHQDRNVNSIYFDDINYSSIRQNLLPIQFLRLKAKNLLM